MSITSLLRTNQKIREASNETLNKISNFINKLTVLPASTEGYKTAEVTLGGIDTNEIDSSTWSVKDILDYILLEKLSMLQDIWVVIIFNGLGLAVKLRVKIID